MTRARKVAKSAKKKPKVLGKTCIVRRKEPTASEVQTIAAYAQKALATPKPPKLTIEACADGVKVVSFDPTEPFALTQAQLSAVTGSVHLAANVRVFSELTSIAEAAGTPATPNAVEALLAQMMDMAPRDTVETMLCTQMIAVHRQALRMLHRASQPSPNGMDVDNYRHTQATRLLRLFTTQAAALQAYRGKGPSEQKVTVQHVHVHDGGQAVVGAVSQQAGGVGGGSPA